MCDHGGNIYEIERKLNISRDSLLDFSSNINPLGTSRKFADVMKAGRNISSRYPDIEYSGLKNKLSNHYNINERRLIAGNGAAEILSLYFRTILPKKALIISPTFSEYERALHNIGAAIGHFKLDEDRGFIPDSEKLSAELKNGYDLVVMCNPNNPTGHMMNLPFIERVCEELTRHDARLFIDESFMDFVSVSKNQSSLKFMDKYSNLFILKSLTKFFAIPGLRLGFGACSDEGLIRKMKSLQDPWSINCIADLAGQVLPDDKKYIEKTRNYVDKEKDFLSAELMRNKSLKIYEPQCNFILVKLNAAAVSAPYNACELQTALLEYKILIRNCSNFKFLSDRFFRIAVKSRKDNKYFIKKLFQII